MIIRLSFKVLHGNSELPRWQLESPLYELKFKINRGIVFKQFERYKLRLPLSQKVHLIQINSRSHLSLALHKVSHDAITTNTRLLPPFELQCIKTQYRVDGNFNAELLPTGQVGQRHNIQLSFQSDIELWLILFKGNYCNPFLIPFTTPSDFFIIDLKSNYTFLDMLSTILLPQMLL